MFTALRLRRLLVPAPDTRSVARFLILFFLLLSARPLWAQQPAISGFSPSSGPVGSLVTITGSDLSSPTSLTIGGVAAIPVSNDGSTLVAMVMPGSVSGAISISTAAGSTTSSSVFNLAAGKGIGIQQGEKVPGAGGQLGFSVAISADGNTAVAGAASDNSLVGSASVYVRSGGVWTLQAKLTGTSNIGNSQQGRSVALSADGNTLAVGGSGDNNFQGAVWVYTRSGATWSQQSKLTVIGNIGGASVGYSLALSADGNTIVTGGYTDNASQGAAWVFNRNGSTWAQQTKLTGTGNTGAANRGISVAISADGKTILSGGTADNSSQGAGWIFTRSGSTWFQQAKLIAPGAVGSARVGGSTALSADGNTAIMGGATDNSNQGGAWVFTRTGSTWSFQSKLFATDNVGAARQGSGVSLSADGNLAVFGGAADNGGVGALWVFARTGSTWSQQGSKQVGTGRIGGSQGGVAALSADGTTAMTSSNSDNSLQGALWFFVVSNDASLSGLATGASTLSPSFAASTTSYSVTVPAATGSITLTPTASNSTSTITVNGSLVNSGTASGAIALSTGSNLFSVVVTAQDGTTKTYTVTVLRCASISAALTGPSFVCGAGSNAALRVSIQGGTSPYTLTYSGGTIPGYTSGSLINVTPQSTTTYTLTSVSDAQGCAADISTPSIQVAVDALPQLQQVGGGGNYCDGLGRTVSLAGSETGFSYQLVKDGQNFGPPVAGTGNALNFGTQPAGTYTVVASSVNGCTVIMTGNAVVTNLGQFSVSLSTPAQYLCTAGSATDIVVSGGPANGFITYSVNGGSSQSATLDGSGAAVISTGALSANATYRVTSVSNGSCATAASTSITVYVGTITANTPGNAMYCAGVTVPAYTFSGNFPAGTQFSWSVSNGAAIGLNSTGGTGNEVPAFTTANSSSTMQTAFITVLPNVTAPAGCKVVPQTWAIRVQPSSAVTITSGADQMVCAGAITAPITLQGNASGTSFRWSSSNSAIGATSGSTTTAVPSFLAQNNTGSPSLTATITVTPVLSGCAGTPVTTTLTVNRSVTSLSYPTSTICSSNAVNQSPSISGSTGGTFTYVDNATGTATGLNLNASTGVITPMSSTAGTYTVTYTLPGSVCSGTATATVTITAGLVVDAPSSRTVCSGQPMNITFTSAQSATPGFAYNWRISGVSGSNASALGIPLTGTGNISATPANNTGAPIRVMVQVWATAPGACTSSTRSFYVTVNPCGPITQSTGTGGGSTTARAIARPQQAEVVEGDLSVGPNPTQNRMTVRLDAETMKQNGVWSVQLLTQQGAPVSRAASFSGSTTTVDLTGQPAGIYVLQLVDQKSGRIVRKQVVKL